MNRKNILTTLTPQTSTSMGMRTGMNGMTIMDIIVKKPGCATGTVRKSMWIRKPERFCMDKINIRIPP